MNRRQSALRQCAAVAALFAFPLSQINSAAANIISWNGAVGASFAANASWLGNVAPQSTDTAQFNLAATATFDSNPTTAALSIATNKVIFQATGTPRIYTVQGATGITGTTLTLGTSTSTLLLNSATTNLFSGASLLVNAGNQVGGVTFNLGSNGGATATATFEGAGSSLAVTGQTTLGNSAGGDANGIANLTFQNNASASFAALTITGLNSSATGAHVTVSSNAKVAATGDVLIGASTFLGQNSSLLITGTGSTFTQTGNASLTIGTNLGTGNIASLTLANSAIYSTGTKPAGTAAVTIYNTGTLSINDFTTFNSHGDITIDGGTFIRSNAGIFNLDPGATFTSAHNAHVTIGPYDLANGSTFTLQSGTTFTASSYFDVGNDQGTGTAGTLIVDGTSSTFSAGSNPWWGASGSTGTVIIRNGATATIHSGLSIAVNSTDNTNGSGSVQSGATLATDDITIADSGGNIIGALTVTGANSKINQSANSALYLGADTGTATLSVLAGGTFNAGAGGVNIFPSGQLLITGGTFNAKGPILLTGGTLALNSGTLNLTAADLAQNGSTSLSIGQASQTAIVNVNTGSTFTTALAFSLISGVAVHINGGTLHTQGLLTIKSGAALTLSGTPGNWSGRLNLDPQTTALAALFETVNAADKNAKLATLASQIFAGRNGGDWNGANGITSPAAALNPTQFGVGLFDNAIAGKTTLPGTPPLTSAMIFIATALLGDGNFDNVVNAADLNLVAANWNSHTALGWTMGDLNNDGTVDSLDAQIVVQHWTASPFAPQINYTTNFSYTLIPVPEPATFSAIILPLYLWLRNSRRHNRRTL